MPALTKLNKSKRIKVNDFIWNEIKKIAEYYKISEFKFKHYPINNYSIRNSTISSMNIFESLKYLENIDVTNHLILSLKKSDSELNNLSKYRKRDIKKSIKENIIKAIDNKNLKNIELEMKEFRLTHLKAAEKLTRPIETWNYMENALKKNLAQLLLLKRQKCD